MSNFQERQKAFESKFAHDQELRFKVIARRNRLLGEWVAANLLGLGGSEAAAYAKSVVAADFEKPGDDDVVAKVMADITAKGADFSEHRLRNRMSELLETAMEQVSAEKKG